MLLDTASMYFRAFFGVPEINAPDGTPVNAVRGLMDFICRLVAEYRPTDLVCCWDNDWRPQWRVDLIPSYKAHRVVEEVATAPDVEEVPTRCEVQIPIILEVLDAFGIACIGADHYEADDVIGTLATGAGQPVDIVTGDRDLFQLVDDDADVRVLYIARGVGNHERVDQRLGARQVRRRRPPVRRLRDPARRRLRRPARASPASGRRPPPRCSAASATSTASSPPPHDPDSDMGPGPRGKIKAAADYLAVAPRSWRSSATSTSPARAAPPRPARPRPGRLAGLALGARQPGRAAAPSARCSRVAG